MSNYTPQDLREMAAYLRFKVAAAFKSGQTHEKRGGATKDRSYKCTIRRAIADHAATALAEYANELARESCREGGHK